MSDKAQAPQNRRQLADAARWSILAVLLVTIFMALVNVSTVNVALPTIQRGLGATPSDLQWVLTGYTLTFGVILVAAGRAGDILGRGGFFIIGVVIFTLASLACGLATSPRALNIARFMQGVGSGVISPQGIGMIQQHFRGGDRGRAFGYFGTMVGVAVAIGPVLGGFLIKLGGDEYGWRLSFLFNVPVGILILALAWAWFPRPLFSPGKGFSLRALRQVLYALDPVGALLLGLAVFSVLYPFMEYQSSAATWLLIPAAAVLTVAWVAWERYYLRLGHSPMVDLGIFRTPSFSNGATLMTLYFLGMTSIWIVVMLYFQEDQGRTALEAGMVGLPAAILSAFASNWAGKRVLRLGRMIVIWGLVLALAGMLLSIGVVWLHELAGVSIWWMVLTLSLVGIAQGAVISPNQTLTLDDVPIAYAGSSGAVMQTGQRIGTSVGIAIITSALFALVGVASWSVAVMASFGLVIVAILLALAVGIKDLRDRERAVSPASPQRVPDQV